MCAFAGMVATIHKAVSPDKYFYGCKNLAIQYDGKLKSSYVRKTWINGRLRDATKPSSTGMGKGIYAYSRISRLGNSPWPGFVFAEIALFEHVVVYKTYRGLVEGYMAQQAEIHVIWCANEYDLQRVQEAYKNTDIIIDLWSNRKLYKTEAA